MLPRLSIVFSSLNEERNPFFVKSLERLSKHKACEIICVDGGSEDKTEQIVTNNRAKFIPTNQNMRSERLNTGIKASVADLILLHHPRSLIEDHGIEYLINNAEQLKWGAFKHCFDNPHLALKITSWYSNQIRGKLKEIYYLDHCIYCKKEILEQAGLIDPVAIFEDTLLSKKLSKISKPLFLDFKTTTSAIRFEQKGIFRQVLLNQYLKLKFQLGFSKDEMNQLYEKGIELNSKYKK